MTRSISAAPMTATAQTHVAPQPVAALTPNMIMMVLRRRLQDLDSQITGAIEAIEANSEKAARLSEAVAKFQELHSDSINYEQSHDDTNGITPDQLTVDVEVNGETIAMGLAELCDYYDIDMIELNHKGHYTSDALGALVESMKSQLRTLNSGNEERMVLMQSLTQQRSASITMSTQLLNSVNESTMAILRNLK